jgi:uncharacterized membrane protein
MRQLTRQLFGIGALGAAMYYLDPTSGSRRRARLRDQAGSLRGRIGEQARVTAVDFRHRARGMFAAACGWFESGEAADDILAERARSRLGRCVAHPGALEIQVQEGQLTVSGAILAEEHARLLRTLRATPGVHAVEDHTQVFESGAHIPALQGGRPRRPRPELLQDNWSPTARTLVAGVGAAVVLLAARSRGVTRVAGVLLGGALMSRAVTNQPVRRLAIADREISIHKSLQVQAAVHEVFERLANFENFPQFMRNILSVRVHADGTSSWVAAGPAGSTVKWTSVITHVEQDRELAWQTLPRSVVEHHGMIRVEPLADNGSGQRTRVDVQMSYRPPAGALGHVVAKLFGADPKTELDQDLLRLKTFLETGRRPRDAAAQTPKGYVSGRASAGAGAAGNGSTAVDSSNQT